MKRLKLSIVAKLRFLFKKKPEEEINRVLREVDISLYKIRKPNLFPIINKHQLIKVSLDRLEDLKTTVSMIENEAKRKEYERKRQQLMGVLVREQQ
jgi:hypothetical protein